LNLDARLATGEKGACNFRALPFLVALRAQDRVVPRIDLRSSIDGRRRRFPARKGEHGDRTCYGAAHHPPESKRWRHPSPLLLHTVALGRRFGIARSRIRATERSLRSTGGLEEPEMGRVVTKLEIFDLMALARTGT
jgi:hypothetical protein